MAAHVARTVVGAAVWHERAGDRVRHHEQEGDQPCGADHLGSMGFGLPCARCQWIADGAVALQRDGHEVEGGHAD